MQIKRNDGPGSPDKPRVYVNSIFEIQENATTLPSNKVTELFLSYSPVLFLTGCGSASHWCGSGSSFSLQCGSGSRFSLKCKSRSGTSSKWWKPATTSLSTLGLHFKLSGLHCERPRPATAPFCGPLKLLYFDFNTDPDPDFTPMRIRIQLPKILRIRIHNPELSELFVTLLIFMINVSLLFLLINALQ